MSRFITLNTDKGTISILHASISQIEQNGNWVCVHYGTHKVVVEQTTGEIMQLIKEAQDHE